MMRGAAVSDRWRKFSSRKQPKLRFPGGISSRRILRLLPFLVVLALVPPVFFHFRLKRVNQKPKGGQVDNGIFRMFQAKEFNLQHIKYINDDHKNAILDFVEINKRSDDGFSEGMSFSTISTIDSSDDDDQQLSSSPIWMRLQECRWLHNRPLVCAHGGDSSNNIPNTMGAYYSALHSHVDCIEMDVSRSSDGVLFAVHDRDLQKISGNATARIGHLSRREIKELDVGRQFTTNFQKQDIPTVEDALSLISESVSLVILDAKVGPPLFEKGLAEDILYAIKRTNCKNCIVWAKSDRLIQDTIKQAQDITVGYIVMNDPSTGAQSKLLRMKGAGVVGVHYPLIDETLVKTLHRSGKKVYAWTVDEETSMRRMLYEHVDAIVTGKPKILQSLMESMREECNKGGFGLP